MHEPVQQKSCPEGSHTPLVLKMQHLFFNRNALPAVHKCLSHRCTACIVTQHACPVPEARCVKGDPEKLQKSIPGHSYKKLAPAQLTTSAYNTRAPGPVGTLHSAY